MEPDVALMVDDVEINRINFGITPIESESIVSVDMWNKGKNKLLNIEVKPLHQDVSVKEYPKHLEPGERKRLVLRYKPIIQLDRGIDSELLITGGYVV